MGTYGYLGVILVLFWCYFGVILVLFLGYCGMHVCMYFDVILGLLWYAFMHNFFFDRKLFFWKFFWPKITPQ